MTMAALWKAYKVLAADETKTDITLRIKHQAMMLAVLVPWQWLKSTVVTRCKDILSHPYFCHSDWLFPLVKSASQMVELRLSKHTFDPRMCGELPGDTFLFSGQVKMNSRILSSQLSVMSYESGFNFLMTIQGTKRGSFNL